MKIKKIFFFVVLVCFSLSLKATNYYINSAIGNDANKGTSSTDSWKTVLPVKLIQLNPGDSILFATGQKFAGMLWPEGRASTSMSNYAQLVNAGYDAVKAVFASAKVIVHVSNGWDNSLFRWNIGGLISNGAKFDVIGMSLYPSYVAAGWASANQQCLTNMNDMVSLYNKEVMVVEVGMPWDSAPDCKLFIADLIAKVKSVINKKGLGVLYWEPQSYGGWKGYTLGAFDNSGKPTVAMDAFKN